MPAYKTIEKPSQALYNERNSKFYSFAYPLADKSEVEDALKSLKKLHPKASHLCYAWRIGQDKNSYRANDAGEPSGTAGLPILQQIDSFQLTDILVVVVRYFGGTKLGSSGLVAAYKMAARLSLDASFVVTKKRMSIAAVEVEFSNLADTMALLKKNQTEVLSAEYGAMASLRIRYDQDIRPELNEFLKKVKGKLKDEGK